MVQRVTFFVIFILSCLACSGYADTISNSYSVNAQIPIGGSAAYYVPISGAPSNGIVTSVEAQFTYIAYNGTQNYVLCRFNKGSDPGSTGGVVLVSQGALPSGNPGTYGYISFSNWNGQSVNANYYFRFFTASGSSYAPTIQTIYVRVNYSVPPSAPTLSSPANYGVRYNQTPHTFSWYSVSGADRYRIHVDNNSGFGSPEINTETTSIQTSSYTSLSNNVYYWRVQAGNSAGQWGDWSAVRTFIVDTPPPAPTLSAPANGSTFNQGTSIPFSWSGPVSYSIDRNYLRIVPGTNLDNNPVYHLELPGTSQTISSTGWAPGTYTWAVRAIKNHPDGFDQYTYETTIGWGQYATRTFTIQSPPPSAPTILTPADGITLNDSTPDLSWTHDNASYFQVQIATDSNFTSIVCDDDHVYTLNCTPGDQYCHSLSDGTYWWRVRAFYGSWGAWAARSFTISTSSSTQPPIQTWPADGVILNDSTPDLSWTHDNASYFQVQIATDSNFTSIVCDDDHIYTLNCTPGNQYCHPLSDDTYWWRVRAYGTNGIWSGWVSRRFTVQAGTNPQVSVTPTSGTQETTFLQPGTGFTPNSTATLYFTGPDGPSQYSGKATDSNGEYTHSWPCNGCPVGTYTYYAVDDTTLKQSNIVTFEVATVANKPSLTSPVQNANITTSHLIFEWSSVIGAVSYEILVDNNSGFGSTEIHEPGIFVQNLTGTSYQVTNWLPDNVYYWKVIAHLANGSTSESAVGTFTYHLPVHPEPVFVPLFRLKKDAIHDHYYTTIPAHRDLYVTQKQYTYEKVECYISDRKFNDPNCGYLFHLWDRTNDVHFYTSNDVERNNRIIAGFTYEGIVGFLYTVPTEGMYPLVHLEQVSATDHFYSISKVEIDGAQDVYQFLLQGVAGYVSPMGLKNAMVHSRPQANFGGADLGSGAYRGLNSMDLSMSGRGPDLGFAHYYNSFNFNHYPMGQGWSHNLYSYILEDYDGNVMVFWGNGSVSTFTFNPANGTYSDTSGNHDVLTPVHTPPEVVNYGYSLKRKDQSIYEYRRLDINPIYGRDATVLISVTDWKGNKLTFDYQDVVTVSDQLGRALRLSFNAKNQVQKVEEILNGSQIRRSVSFTYNDQDLLGTFVDARGETTRYTYYNEPGSPRDKLLKSITYPKGNTVNIEYDGVPLKVSGLKLLNQHRTGISYPDANTAVVADPQGNQYRVINNGLSVPTSTGAYNPNTGSWEMASAEYNDTNNPFSPTRVIDKENNSTWYQYDLMGNVTRVTNTRGRVANFHYNDKNNITSSEDFHLEGSAVNTTTYVYDASGNRLDRVINPENESTWMYYDAATHDLTSVVDGRGFTTSYGYDTYGNLGRVTDAEGNVTDYINDYAGRTVEVKDAEQIRTTYDYDELDNPEGITNFLRDGVNALRHISMIYDSNGNLQNVNWINQGRTSQTVYGYDALDRLASVTDPLQRTSYYTYNDNNQVRTRQDNNLVTTTYGYDENSRLKSIAYPGRGSITIGRDKNGNPRTISNSSGTSSFTYNNLNLIDTYTGPYNQLVRYDYDDAGRLWHLTYPGNKVVTYTYDAAGRLEHVTDWLGGTTTYVYDGAGNLQEAVRPNGTRVVYTYDRASRLTGISDQRSDNSLICKYTYELDGVGNHRSLTVDAEPLTGTPQAVDISYTHDLDNRMLTAGSTSFTYDNNGNMRTQAGGGLTTTYSWDYENMLADLTCTSSSAGVISSAQYVYDGMNNRIARIDNGEVTRYVLDLNGPMSRVLAETDANGTIRAYYVYGLGLISRITPSDERLFYHFNNRGDTVALSNNAGVITDSYAYDEYGVLLAQTGSTANPFTFVGAHGVMEEGDDRYFMRARYYDAKAGRFLSQDPLGFEGGDWNTYNYVSSNPNACIDPEGEIEYGGTIYNLTDWKWIDNPNTAKRAKQINLGINLALFFGTLGGSSAFAAGSAMALGVNELPTLFKMGSGELSSKEALVSAAWLIPSAISLSVQNYAADAVRKSRGIDFLHTKAWSLKIQKISNSVKLTNYIIRGIKLTIKAHNISK